MREKSTLEVVQGIYEAFGRGDIPAVLALIDPDGQLQFEGPATVAWAGTWRGREGWGSFFKTIGENLDQIVVSMEPFAVQGDRAVFAGRYSAIVRRNGRRIDSPLVHLWTVRNGLIVSCVEATDTAAESAACT
jgi:ketosteroid isomerase-like protein